jgi:DNA polymerase
MTTLHIDFETRSACDLRVAGLDNYAKHPTTDVWCMAAAFDSEAVELLTMLEFDFIRPGGRMHEHVKSGGIVVAHNAAFELAIWNNVMVKKYGWPPLDPKQVRCTMAMAYAMSLPGALENAAAALGLAAQKDMTGHRVMMQLAKPKTTDPLTWHTDEAKIAKLYAYCKQDVEVERQVESRLLALTPAEQQLWLIDQKINNRGIYVDLPAVKAAIQIVEAEQARLNHAMRVVTKNAVATCNAVGQLGDWLKYRGVEIDSVAKADVLDALQGDLPDDCRKALELRKEAAKSSTAKLKKMVESVSGDGRLRGMFQYHGAATGRWAARKVQLHNLPRPTIPQQGIEFILDHIERRDAAAFMDNLYGSVLDVISSCLRGFLRAAPGHELIAVDYSNIEGRTLAWLAGEEWKLQAFRDFDTILGYDAKNKPIRKGPDLYLVAAATLYRVNVESLTKDSPERQPGKTCELAFGFQGSVGAWRKMENAAPDMPHFPDEEVHEFKDKWRSKHPRTVAFWHDLERAVTRAIQHPGEVYEAGDKRHPIKYKVAGSFLWCKLPSGRNLCYPYPRLDWKNTYRKPDGGQAVLSGKKAAEGVPDKWVLIRSDENVPWYMTVDSLTNKWGEASLYGGELCNNVTQATARDLLAHAMVNLEMAGFAVVLHVHDEVVVEVKDNCGPEVLPRVEKIMKTLPVWAAGLPVATEGWRGRRYRK